MYSDLLRNLLKLLLLQQMIQSCLGLAVKRSRSTLILYWIACWHGLRLSSLWVAWLSLGGRESRNIVSQSCCSQLLVVERGQVLWQNQLLLQLLNQHLVLVVLQELHLLLVLLLGRELRLVGLVLLDELADGLRVRQVDDVVLVASLVARNVLVGRVPPVPIDSEFVHHFLRVQKLHEVVRRR